MSRNGPTAAPAVVFDTVVLIQALISPRGPAARCLAAAADGRVRLNISRGVLAETENVAGRPRLSARFGITQERRAKLLQQIIDASALIDPVPHVFDLPRDPKDEMLIDLAAAAGATRLISRDRDLLDLSDPAVAAREDAMRFRAALPDLLVTTPERLLAELDAGL